MTMELLTKVEIKDAERKIGHDEGIMLLGSCFSDNIGERLKKSMFPVCVNPFGTLYNPSSIAAALQRTIDNRLFSADELMWHNGMWHSFYHHSRFSSHDKGKALTEINRSISEASESLSKAKTLVVTFGTAFVYKRTDTGEVVANCHKLPASFFTRTLLTTDEICAMWSTLLEELWQLNPGLHVIFTVSPIRHLADSAHGNQISKSTLLLAVENLTGQFPGKTDYFPSYEIMLDELRDYRFYAPDMVHPSDVAVDYIMQRFATTYFTQEAKEAAEACRRLGRMLDHRFLTDNPEEIGKFRTATRLFAEKLVSEMPYLQNRINNLLSKR